MTRRNVQRVDYKNPKPLHVLSSDESDYEDENESDDDFEMLTPPVKKLKSKGKEKSSLESKNRVAKSDNKTKADKDKTKADKAKRKTRTSNADYCLEQDVLTAIELSQKDCSENSSGNSSGNLSGNSSKINSTGEELVEICPSNNSSVNYDEGVQKPSIKKRDMIDMSRRQNTKTNLVSDDSDSDDPKSPEKPDSTKDTIDDTKAVKNVHVGSTVGKENLSVAKKPSVTKKQQTVKQINNNIVKTTNLAAKKVTIPSVVEKGPSQLKFNSNTKSPNVPLPRNSLPGDNSVNKIVTPGRLRLGLSRNKRVAKPLHPNVTIT